MSDAEFLFIVFFSAAVTAARLASSAAGLGVGTADAFLPAPFGFDDICHSGAYNKYYNADYYVIKRSHSDSFLSN